jgi:XTP/dITP diphosphohydrolase
MDTKRPNLLIATTNKGKLREFRALAAGLPIELVALDRFGKRHDIEETGLTFAENAALKAAGYAVQAGMVTLADDSGLEVIALNGRPGVFSARYGGANTSFDSKIAKLLAEIDEASDTNRSAQFVAAMAVADQDGRIVHKATGICRGHIARQPSGDGGFGYDPVFVPEGYDKTFGELSETIKREIGHRGRAFSQIIPFLRGFFAI